MRMHLILFAVIRLTPSALAAHLRQAGRRVVTDFISAGRYRAQAVVQRGRA